MSSHSDELYQQVILEHNRNPRNFRKLDNSTHQAEGYNPLCGDHIFVYARVESDKISEVTFQGESCAICKASSSMMTQAMAGATRSDALSRFEEFRKLVTKELDPSAGGHQLGKLTVFSGIWKYPSRVKCAILPWHTLKAAFDKEKVISTE